MSIESNQVYRHRDGKTAMILGVAEPRDETELLYMPLVAIAVSTESDASILLKRSTEGVLCFCRRDERCKPVVVYLCSGRLWFRTPEHFNDSFTLIELTPEKVNVDLDPWGLS
jgi:hypothetical protein